MTRRLRRGSRACSPRGRSHFSFVGERKVCKRKPAARRLREKALYCPFLKEGVRNVARSTVGLPTFTFVRARAHSFPLSKRARLFPSAAYRRSAPAQSAVGMLTPCRLGSSNVACIFLQHKRPAGFHIHAGLCYSTGREPHQTGEPRGLLPSGGSFAAKPHVSRAVPRPMGAVWGQGVLPLVKRGGSLTTTTRLRQGKRRNWGKSRCGPPQACAVRGRKKPPRGRHKRLSLNADTAYQRNVEFV